MLEAIRKSQDGMAHEVSVNIIAWCRKRVKFGGFTEDMMQFLLERIWNKLQYALKDPRKLSGQLEECSDLK